MSTSLETLIEKLSVNIHDFLEVATTTNIAGSSTDVISTTLNEYDDGADDFFNDWYCYIDGVNNAGINRKVADYVTATGTLTLQGANLAAESAAVNIRLYRYSRDDKVSAIQDAILEKYPQTFLYLDNTDLVTGNILPPFNWATSSTLDFYTEPSGTLAKNTSGTYKWRGSSSAKVTASGANDKLYISSNVYPRLLDLMDKNADLKGWVYGEVANDPYLRIKTWQKDGTAQTLTSSTTTYATKKCLIELEDQSLNDDLDTIEVWLGVTTDTKYSYFDMPRLIGKDVHEYLLPKDFQDGDVSEVYVQTGGHSDDICDDLQPTDWRQVLNSKIRNDGTHQYLYLPDWYGDNRQIRLVGQKPLESLSAATDTISLDSKEIRPLIAYAAHLLFERQAAEVSSEDRDNLKDASMYWLGKHDTLKKLNPPRPNTKMKLPRLY